MSQRCRSGWLPEVILTGLLITVFCCSGCQGDTAEMVELRRAVLLAEEPTPSVTIEQARQTVADSEEVVLIGKVGVPKIERWHEPTSAEFAVSEGTPGSEYNVGPDHDPSTCPFCSNRWKDEDSLAIVKLMDDHGQVLPVNPLKLLRVSEGDQIVVRGQPVLNESGFLEVHHAKIFVRH